MSEPLRILVVGEDKPGWGPGVCREAFLSLGHRAELFNLGEVTFPMARSLFWRAVHKLSRTPVVVWINQAFREFMERRISWKPDLVLIFKGDTLLPETIRWLKQRTGAALFNWQTDDYFSPALSSAHAIRSIGLYDCIFAHTRANVPELSARGARRAEYLPHGADPALCRPIDLNRPEPYETDLLFMGSWRRERQQMFEELVSRGGETRLSIRGFQWKHLPLRSSLRPYTHFDGVPWDRYGETIRRSKINLVFLVRFDTGRRVVPLRLFEIPAAGGFMLVEKGAGEAEEFYRPGEEMAYFQDVGDLKDQTDYFLRHEEERRRIALAGQQRAIRGRYFYTDRMERMVQVYRELRLG